MHNVCEQLTFRNVEWIRISCCHKLCHKELRFKDLETAKLYNSKFALKLVCKPSCVWSKCAVWDFFAQRVISETPVPTWATRMTRIERALRASDFWNNKQMEMHRSYVDGRSDVIGVGDEGNFWNFKSVWNAQLRSLLPSRAHRML